MFLSVILDPNATSSIREKVSNDQWDSVDRLTERVPGKVISDKIRLEEGAHLRITRTGMIQDEEVNLESYHVDDNWGDNETSNTSSPVPKLVPLFPSS